MKSRALLLVLALTLSTSLSACVTSRFEWGGYENALYQYAKQPGTRPAYQKSLELAVETGRKTGRVAPGLLAELGYLYLEEGNVERALPLFEEEMRRFPESKAFLSDVVTRAKGGSAAVEGSKS
jgi:hypothetical protein